MGDVLKFGTPEERALRELLDEVEQSGGVISGPDYVFTRKDLEKALDYILTDPKDWKGPIDKVVPKSALLIYQVACEFFTATTLDVLEIDDTFVRVVSAGYRAGPAGDH